MNRRCNTRAQSPALGPFPRQRRLAGRPGHGPQSASLDRAHRPGRAGGNHQDPQTALLLPGRTDHSQGATPHPASSPGLALAEPVQKRSGETARPATPLLTTPTATIRRTTQSPRRPAPGWPHVSPAAVCQADFALRRRCGPSTSPWRGCHTPCPAGLERIKATRSLSGSSHPLLPRGGQILSVDLGLGRALHGT